MKNTAILFGLTILLIFSACKDKSVAQEIVVLSPQEFYNATANKDIQLVDVRTAEEFGEGHLAHAANIDVLEDDFSSKVKSLDPNQPVYVYCRSGKRSEKASSILKGLGFKEVYDMEGGYLNWESKGFQAKN